MSRLPLVEAKVLEKLLLHLGFKIKRQKGSHVFYRHADGRYTTLPHHKGRVIGRSLIREILRQIDLTPEEYIELLKKVK
jgi:predicted RNA binding protein YcfA (HicA-like mRNA interferase family)